MKEALRSAAEAPNVRTSDAFGGFVLEIKGLMLLKDYPTVEAAEVSLADPGFRWRRELILWEYVLLRAAGKNGPPPTAFDHYALERRVIFAHPAMIAFVLGLCVAMAGLFALAGAGTDMPVLFALPALGALTQLWQFSRSARAMRMVWSATKRGSLEHLDALRNAALLDPPRS
jgi:hypothetical protein